MQPIPENDGDDKQDEEESNIATMKGLRREAKRENSEAKKSDRQNRE
ncbi:MAG: hypothetical protein WAN60_07445 [Candidatus Sulfotelmatobacter sp.]